MGEYAVPLLVAVAWIALMYVCCLRPMRHARGDANACCAPSQSDPSTANEIAVLGREIEELRRSMAGPADAGCSRSASQADIPI